MKINPDDKNIVPIVSEEIKEKDLDTGKTSKSKFDNKLNEVVSSVKSDSKLVDKLEIRLKEIVKREVSETGTVNYDKITKEILSEVVLDVFPSLSNTNGLKKKVLDDVSELINNDPVLKDYFKKYIEKLKTLV